MAPPDPNSTTDRPANSLDWIGNFAIVVSFIVIPSLAFPSLDIRLIAGTVCGTATLVLLGLKFRDDTPPQRKDG